MLYTLPIETVDGAVAEELVIPNNHVTAITKAKHSIVGVDDAIDFASV